MYVCMYVCMYVSLYICMHVCLLTYYDVLIKKWILLCMYDIASQKILQATILSSYKHTLTLSMYVWHLQHGGMGGHVTERLGGGPAHHQIVAEHQIVCRSNSPIRLG